MVAVKRDKKNRGKGNVGTLLQFLNPRYFILYFDLLRQTIIKSTIIGAGLHFKQIIRLRAGGCSVITGIGDTFKGETVPFSVNRECNISGKIH
jgi:hypothetical protein